MEEQNDITMKKSVNTPYGTVSTGTNIRIIKMFDTTTPSRAFPDGIDHEARKMNGRTGKVTWIDGAGALHGTWGGLAVLPECDVFSVI